MSKRQEHYWVVNAGRGRSATHIMRSKTPSTPGAGAALFGALVGPDLRKTTLCGLIATRHVNVFSPAAASCRECRRRWELATKAADTRQEVARLRALAQDAEREAAKIRYGLWRTYGSGDPGKTLGYYPTQAGAQAAAARDAGGPLTWQPAPEGRPQICAWMKHPDGRTAAFYVVTDAKAMFEEQLRKAKVL